MSINWATGLGGGDATAGTALEREGVHALGTQSTWFYSIYNQTFRVCWANDPLHHYSWDVARPGVIAGCE